MIESIKEKAYRRTGAAVLMVCLLASGAYTLTEHSALAAGEGTKLGPIRIDPRAPIEQLKPVPKERLVAGSPIPAAGARDFYNAPNGAMKVGVWESEPATMKIDMPFDEYVWIVEGEGVVRGTDGRSWTYKPGDSFVLPQGFKGEVQMTTHFRKLFVDVIPARPQ